MFNIKKNSKGSGVVLETYLKGVKITKTVFWSYYKIQKEWSYNLRPVPDLNKKIYIKASWCKIVDTTVGVFPPMPLLLGLKL